MAAGKGGYLVEFMQIGNSVKVSAVDPATGLEVSIVGAANTHRDILTRTAVQKLEFMLAKKQAPAKPGISC